MPKIEGSVWFNTSPLLPEDFSGKIVLVVFWRYSCVNCLRMLPYLKKFWEMYEQSNFLLLGIHAGEFDFEKDVKNIEYALAELQINWPVVMDSGFRNWNNFSNHFWPARYVFDAQGNIVYSHFGEGSYMETQQVLQELLATGVFRKKVSDIKSIERSKAYYTTTPETYCGYGRGFIANHGGYAINSEKEYTHPQFFPKNTIALEGMFLATSQYLQAESVESKLRLHFCSKEVNLVLSSHDGRAVAQIYYNETLPGIEILGKDVVESGEVAIDKPKMYRLLKSERKLEGVITVEAKRGKFRAYSFTFS